MEKTSSEQVELLAFFKDMSIDHSKSRHNVPVNRDLHPTTPSGGFSGRRARHLPRAPLKCFAHNFFSFLVKPEVKVSRNGPIRRSGKRIIAGKAFRLEFLVGWYYDADATMAVPELY